MREIKYKAQKPDGNWIYGLPTYDLKYLFDKENLDSADNYAIIPETLCEITPFKDCKEKEIYKNDTLTDCDGEMVASNYTVFFDEKEGQWMLDCSLKQDRSRYFALCQELRDFQYENVGNIHDKK